MRLTRANTNHWIVLITILWPTFALRFFALGAQELHGDKAVSNDPAASALRALGLWTAVRIVQRGFTLRLVDHTGVDWGLWQGTAFDNRLAKKWPVEKVIRQIAGIVLPDGRPSGDYALLVSVSVRQGNEAVFPGDGSTEVEVTTVKVAP